MKKFFLAILSVSLFMNCEGESTGKRVVSAPSSGNINTLAVVVDNDLWDGSIGETIREIYELAKAEFDRREKPLPQFFETNSRVRYRVRSGDYLGKIARKFGVRVSQIKQWNGLRSNNIRVGQRLTIYPRKPVFDSNVTAAPTKNSASGGKTYEVRNGDSLWTIAQKFPGVSIDDLKSWNNLRSNNLKAGMVLVVSKK